MKLERDYQKKDLEQAAVMEEKLTTLFQTIDDVTLRLSKEPEIAGFHQRIRQPRQKRSLCETVRGDCQPAGDGSV